MRADWPELSDLLLETDPVTLQRKPASREAVRAVLRQHGRRAAERILDRIPGGAVLDEATVDGILVRSHCELQRLSFEFRNGHRLLQLLRPLLDALRALVVTAERLVLVYGVYATLVVVALGLYLSGSFDFGVLASVLVLGPFTLIRPWVILAGAAWAAWQADTVAAAGMALAAGAVMARFEALLDLGHPPWRGLEGDLPGAR